jgi:hypothetical protein
MTEQESEDVLARRRIMKVGRTRLPDVEAERDGVLRVIGVTLATSDRLAFNKNEAASTLGVSVEFFERYVEPDVRFVRRGRRRLYPLAELIWWLWRSAEGGPEGKWADG